MARFVYAKIYCDLLRHPLLRNRPDSDVRLVVGLLLEAKEHTDDGVLRNLTAENARGLCHIKAPIRKVQEGIDYLVAEGWLIPHPGLAYEIKDFVTRQAADSAAERKARSRDITRSIAVTKRDSNVTSSCPERDPDGEEEKRDTAASAPVASVVLTALDPPPPEKQKAKKPEPTPEQVACRKAIADRFDAEYEARSGEPFRWSPKEHVGIAALAALDRAGGVNPKNGIRALETFIERMAVKPYYAGNFAPRIVAQEVNNLRLPVVPDARATKGPGHAPPAVPIASAERFAADEMEYQERIRKEATP